MAKVLRLNHVVATVAGKKTQATTKLTEAYHIAQKGELFSGLHRTYTPKDEAGDTKPPERKNPSYKVVDLYRGIESDLREMLDGVATQDYNNCQASADVLLDGKVIVAGAPVTFLLYLEKQLVSLKNFIEKLPVRDSAEDWMYQTESALFVTPTARSQATTKLQEPLVLYPATPEHPAQTNLITRDVVIGYWDARKLSGAISRQEQDQMLERVRKLSDAVKVAREEANNTEATPKSVGSAILDSIFGGVLTK